MELYGRKWTRREFEARVGRIEQIGGLRRFVLQEGMEAGVEMIQVRTGAGLSYWISPTKGMDIGLTEYHGVPISWASGNGDVHPSHYDARDSEWLRTASGGLLMTCGLTQVGSPCSDNGQKLGLHGRIHHTSARHISLIADWSDDEYDMQVRGVLEETSLYGDQLRLTRSIRSCLGSNRLEIHDLVENIGFKPSPHLILYHFNFGFPLLNESTTIRLPDGDRSNRDSNEHPAEYDRWSAPDPQAEEKVYYHRLKPDPSGFITAAIHSPDFPVASPGYNRDSTNRGVTVELSWDPATLPEMVQWIMPGAGAHVLGIEPANCRVEGRAAERNLGRMKIMKPGEKLEYRLNINVKSGVED